MAAGTLVLGVGNILLTDEGIGIHVIHYLNRHHPSLPDVSYLDGGTLSYTLAGPIEDAANLIVIDAAELHAAPATIRTFIGADMDRFLGGVRHSVHEVALVDLLVIARLTESLPSNRALIGVQPQDLNWGERPTQTLTDAVPSIAAQVIALIQRWSH